MLFVFKFIVYIQHTQNSISKWSVSIIFWCVKCTRESNKRRGAMWDALRRVAPHVILVLGCVRGCGQYFALIIIFWWLYVIYLFLMAYAFLMNREIICENVFIIRHTKKS